MKERAPQPARVFVKKRSWKRRLYGPNRVGKARRPDPSDVFERYARLAREVFGDFGTQGLLPAPTRRQGGALLMALGATLIDQDRAYAYDTVAILRRRLYFAFGWRL